MRLPDAWPTERTRTTVASATAKRMGQPAARISLPSTPTAEMPRRYLVVFARRHIRETGGLRWRAGQATVSVLWLTWTCRLGSGDDR